MRPDANHDVVDPVRADDPLQGLASFLAVPGTRDTGGVFGFTEGVSSQTLTPGRKLFLS